MRRAISCQRAQQAFRPFRRTDRRSEVHHRLREIPGALIRRHEVRGRAYRRLACRAKQARHHPLDIGVHHNRPAPEGDGRNRRCRVRAQPRQAQQRRLGVRQPPVMLRHDHLRGAHQVARPRIIAQPRPGRHDVGLVRRRQAGNVRPARHPRLEPRAHRRHRGLLQHHLGQPHAIRVRRLARQRPPRQGAAVLVVPAEQVVGDRALGVHAPAMAWDAR